MVTLPKNVACLHTPSFLSDETCKLSTHAPATLSPSGVILWEDVFSVSPIWRTRVRMIKGLQYITVEMCILETDSA